MRRKHRRVWPKGRIPAEFFGDVTPHRLTAEHERKLGGPALAVWRELLRLRGNHAVPMHVSLVGVLEAMRRSPSAVYYRRDAGWSESRVDRAVRRLKDAGLIGWSHRDPVVKTTGGVSRYASTLEVMVLGAIELEELWVPVTTIRWCETTPGRGGYRHGKRGQTDAKGSQSDAKPPPGNAELEGQSDASYNPKESSSSFLSEKKNAAAAAGLFAGRETRSPTADLPTLPAGMELMFRRRELCAARRAGLAFDVAYAGAPCTWFDARYAALRALEIRAGLLDPMERYVRLEAA